GLRFALRRAVLRRTELPIPPPLGVGLQRDHGIDEIETDEVELALQQRQQCDLRLDRLRRKHARRACTLCVAEANVLRDELGREAEIQLDSAADRDVTTGCGLD